MNLHPLIINLAPSGMVPTRAMSAQVPLSVSEIIADARACTELGASMLHLHARDVEGRPSCDPGLMGEIISGIRAVAPQVVITVTTSGREVSELSRRAAVLDLSGALKPDMASLTLGSMNFLQSASVNAPDTIIGLAQRMLERDIKPELEVFDLGMLNMARHLIDKGLLRPPFYFNILLGNIATAQLRLLHLATLLADLPEQSVFSLAGIGRFQAGATALASVLADGARVGLEDSLFMDEHRQHPASNAALVQRLAIQAAAMGRALATPEQTRLRLGLPSR